MKEILKVFKQLVKTGNISPQLDHIEFSDERIIIYNNGNLIVTDNTTEIRGYLSSSDLSRVVSNFSNPEYVDGDDKLLIKEGRKKVSLNKYKLSGGEESFKLPQYDSSDFILINDSLIQHVKDVLYSAVDSSLNQSGDGLIIDCSNKFSKLYSTNGKTMNIGNVFVSKCNKKIFIPLFIAKNIVDYFVKEKSVLYFSENFIVFDNGSFQFISLVDQTSEEVDINSVLSKLSIIKKDIIISSEMVKSINIVLHLVDETIKFEFAKDKLHIHGDSHSFVIEDTVEIDSDIEIKDIKFNKNNIKEGFNNYDTFSIYKYDDKFYILKFKKSNMNFYISPFSG